MVDSLGLIVFGLFLLILGAVFYFNRHNISRVSYRPEWTPDREGQAPTEKDRRNIGLVIGLVIVVGAGSVIAGLIVAMIA